MPFGSRDRRAADHGAGGGGKIDQPLLLSTASSSDAGSSETMSPRTSALGGGSVSSFRRLFTSSSLTARHPSKVSSSSIVTASTHHTQHHQSKPMRQSDDVDDEAAQKNNQEWRIPSGTDPPAGKISSKAKMVINIMAGNQKQHDEEKHYQPRDPDPSINPVRVSHQEQKSAEEQRTPPRALQAPPRDSVFKRKGQLIQQQQQLLQQRGGATIPFTWSRSSPDVSTNSDAASDPPAHRLSLFTSSNAQLSSRLRKQPAQAEVAKEQQHPNRPRGLLLARNRSQPNCSSSQPKNAIPPIAPTRSRSQPDHRDPPPPPLQMKGTRSSSSDSYNKDATTSLLTRSHNTNRSEKYEAEELGSNDIADEKKVEDAGVQLMSPLSSSYNSISGGESLNRNMSTASSGSYEVVYGRLDLACDDLNKAKRSQMESKTGMAGPSDAANMVRPPSQSRALLARPFGRGTLPPEVARKWVVEVSSAEWDADENRWKYRILVQRRHLAGVAGTTNSNRTKQQTPSTSFTAAFTWRSLSEFYWLEKTLRQEFHGGLLLPLLSLALGRPAEAALETTPVQSERLRNWLSDVLNGVRGQGELILDHDAIDLLHSETMETFLYRHVVLPQEEETWNLWEGIGGGKQTDKSRSNDNTKNAQHPDKSGNNVDETCGWQSREGASTFLQRILGDKVIFLTPLELCIGPQPQVTTTTKTREAATAMCAADGPARTLPQRLVQQFPVDVLACQSRALGTAASFEVVDSFASDSLSVAISSTVGNGPATGGLRPTSPMVLGSNDLVIHSELIVAEQELVLHHRVLALQAMEKLQHLTEAEEKVGTAWKRFAVSLANLFLYEKDVEGVRLADVKVSRDNIPHRRVSKSVVDDCLRVMAKQKTERTLPALTSLHAMLTAYVADLSAVEPSVDVYLSAVTRTALRSSSRKQGNTSNVAGCDSGREIPSNNMKDKDSWDQRLKALASSAISDVRRQAMNTFQSGIREGPTGSTDNSLVIPHHPDPWATFMANESLLRQSLTCLCRAAPIRTSRMAWRYWNTEASQCAALHSAALTLRMKVDGASPDALSRMTKRHLMGEQEDRATERSILERIVSIKDKRKNLIPASPESDLSVEVDNDDLDAKMRRDNADKVLRLAHERNGNWDADLAMAIMRVVGIEDPNVRVEETTRDLRLVRKYAIGLRDNLNRCVEAVQRLRESIIGSAVLPSGPATTRASSESDDGYLVKRRREFLLAISKLFSGAFQPENKEEKTNRKSSSMSTSVLAKAGIDTSDPFGWRDAALSLQRESRDLSDSSPRTLGGRAYAYSQARDERGDWLLGSLLDLLNDYYQRVQVIESFVYMECVGIQLEKHFSKNRANALAAFEKKTDVTSAIAVAAKRRLPQLLNELTAKLHEFGPEVSQAAVKETKELHLDSKEIKAALHTLAVRALVRARESSTDRAVAVISMWAREEESNATGELRALGEAMSALEQVVGKEDIETLVYRFPRSSLEYPD